MNISHWRYADPVAAQAAYEAWATSVAAKGGIDALIKNPMKHGDKVSFAPSMGIADGTYNAGSNAIAPKYPWHNHDGSDKCPVPKRRRGEGIEIIGDGYTTLKIAYNCNWQWVKHWRYTQPNPGKAKKWGPWVRDESQYLTDTATPDVVVRKEEQGNQYLRHRVRL